MRGERSIKIACEKDQHAASWLVRRKTDCRDTGTETETGTESSGGVVWFLLGVMNDTRSSLTVPSPKLISQNPTLSNQLVLFMTNNSHFFTASPKKIFHNQHLLTSSFFISKRYLLSLYIQSFKEIFIIYFKVTTQQL